MNFELISMASGLISRQAVGEVVKCNQFTRAFGLSLTEAQAAELVETRAEALNRNGRVEFGGGVIDKIIRAFCDSPYISMHNYSQTICELLEIFYYYKNETEYADDELIGLMKTAFDGSCHGSTELLAGRELDRLTGAWRFGDEESEAEEEDDE